MLKEASAILKEAGVDHAMREAEWLLEAVTGKSSWEIKTFRHRIEEEQVDKMADLLKRRTDGEPLQYITGIAGFRGVELFVGPGVFIPRPETETVAEVAMARLPQQGTLVDVGTGSGAIALAVAAERPDATIFGTEQSAEALQWAEKNQIALLADVAFLQGDLLAPLPDAVKGAVDVIVSNPPYVAQAEARRLPTEVIEHEPHDALIAGGDGLDLIRRLVRDARDYLKPDGALVLEIGETQAEAITTILKREGYRGCKIDRDLAGRDRVASAVWSGSDGPED